MDVTDLFGIEKVKRVAGYEEIEPYHEKKRPLRRDLKAKKGKLVKEIVIRPKLPNPRCALCPLPATEQYPLFPTDVENVWAHVECGSYVPETMVEIMNSPSEVERTIAGISEIDETIAEKTVPSPTYTQSESVANIDATVNGESTGTQEEIVERKETSAEQFEIAPILDEHYRITGINSVPNDRRNLKCSVCQWHGPHSKAVGAPIQCTLGKCVRAFHVTCAQMAGILVDFDAEGNLKALCFQHDPVLIFNKILRMRKKAEADYQIAKTAQVDFQPGTMVIVKTTGGNFEGLILEFLGEKGGCIVQYENHEHPAFILWQMLKPKPVEQVEKPKKKPVYNENKPRKNNAIKNLLSEMLNNESLINNSKISNENLTNSQQNIGSHQSSLIEKEL